MEHSVKRPGIKSPNEKIYAEIKQMNKGDTMVIKKKDWKTTRLPGRSCIRENTGTECSMQTLVDDSGWLITRL